jgi:tRNA G18 (ribose-2'-O)-methylase SpoU
MIVAGQAKVDPKIARDGAEHVEVERRRSLPPLLKKLKSQGYQLVGLEQTTNSHSLYEYRFPHKCALVIGHERLGIPDDELTLLDDAIEIPVYGLPYSYNVVTATTMAMYEYCKQYPTG